MQAVRQPFGSISTNTPTSPKKPNQLDKHSLFGTYSNVQSTSRRYFQPEDDSNKSSVSPENNSVGEGSISGTSPALSPLMSQQQQPTTLLEQPENQRLSPKSPYYFSLHSQSTNNSSIPPQYGHNTERPSTPTEQLSDVLRTPSPLSTPSVTPKSTPSKSAPSTPLKEPQSVPLSFADIVVRDIEGAINPGGRRPNSSTRANTGRQNTSKNSTGVLIMRPVLPMININLKKHNIKSTEQRINAILDMLEKIENKKKLSKKEYERSIEIISKRKASTADVINSQKLEQEEKRSYQIYLDTLRHFKDKIINELCNTDPELNPEAVKSILEAVDMRHMENI